MVASTYVGLMTFPSQAAEPGPPGGGGPRPDGPGGVVVLHERPQFHGATGGQHGIGGRGRDGRLSAAVPVAPYRQIAEIIRRRIASGELPKGARITESEITETYEVARNTARRAIGVLRGEGLIMTVPQRGSYVL